MRIIISQGKITSRKDFFQKLDSLWRMERSTKYLFSALPEFDPRQNERIALATPDSSHNRVQVDPDIKVVAIGEPPKISPNEQLVEVLQETGLLEEEILWLLEEKGFTPKHSFFDIRLVEFAKEYYAK